MDTTRGVDAATTRGVLTPEDMERIDRDRLAAHGEGDAEVLVREFGALAADRDAAPVGGQTRTILRFDADFTARGPGSIYERLAQRLADDNTGSDELRAAPQWVALAARVDRDEFTAAAQRMLGCTAGQAADLADMCGDLAAAGAQMEVVRGVRQDLTALADRVDALLGNPGARREFLLRLANADLPTARQWLERFFPRDAAAAAFLVALAGAAGPGDGGCAAAAAPQLSCVPGGPCEILPTLTEPDCGAPRAVPPEVDAQFVARLQQMGASIRSCTDALDTAGSDASPVNIFRDYAPVTGRLLEQLAPGVDVRGSTLADGIGRAIEEHESSAALQERMRTAVDIAVVLLAGPLSLGFEVALAGAAVVDQGANHDRVTEQRDLGISDGGATPFASWGRAMLDQGVEIALSEAAGGGAGAAVREELGQAGGQFIGALVGEEAAQEYARVSEALVPRGTP